MTSHTPMQDLFEALPPPGKSRTVADLVRVTGLARQKVSAIMCRLTTRGLVSREKTGFYRLTRAGQEARAAGAQLRSGPYRPHTGRRRQIGSNLRLRAWTILRFRKRATIPDLITACAQGHEKDPESNLSRWLSGLARAGLVARLTAKEDGTAPTSPGFTIWMLLPAADTGPNAPVISTRGDVFDPNTGKAHPLSATKKRSRP